MNNIVRQPDRVYVLAFIDDLINHISICPFRQYSRSCVNPTLLAKDMEHGVALDEVHVWSNRHINDIEREQRWYWPNRLLRWPELPAVVRSMKHRQLCGRDGRKRIQGSIEPRQVPCNSQLIQLNVWKNKNKIIKIFVKRQSILTFATAFAADAAKT